ncbi:hypothetical protein N431DRAFT_460296 [Stipitochalara longipes BDJ]|nr:hypothetical protein N431DRAFT_460296 [Stipitochalara longipes BDJ]
MYSQLSTVSVQTEVYDPMEIDTATTKKSSILSKRGQSKKVCWAEDVVDNEYKHTIRKDTYFAHLSQQSVKIQTAIVEQEALIQRQAGEVTRLKGLWEKAQQIGAIPEGFEQYATAFGTAQEVNTAIKNKLWELLLELAPKRQRSDKILLKIQKDQRRLEKKLKVIGNYIALRHHKATAIPIDSNRTVEEEADEIF